ncbi:DUF3784 domain-containing protein [Bacillus xiapuensis]|uniref:DUF3784 domain-containing protein n=1 Tax=Bacillus xiapuensis TaxID=2014075 RepID=UPI000C24A017|nr:DUF3784 domain-containing protein [Bacillus xiapuensis]
MDYQVLVLGLIFLILAYLVGIKKQTHLLAGFNQHRVKDKKKLAELVGSVNFAFGVILIVCSFIRIVPLEIIMPLAVVGYLLLLLYVNAKMVE